MIFPSECDAESKILQTIYIEQRSLFPKMKNNYPNASYTPVPALSACGALAPPFPSPRPLVTLLSARARIAVTSCLHCSHPSLAQLSLLRRTYLRPLNALLSLLSCTSPPRPFIVPTIAPLNTLLSLSSCPSPPTLLLSCPLAPCLRSPCSLCALPLPLLTLPPLCAVTAFTSCLHGPLSLFAILTCYALFFCSHPPLPLLCSLACMYAACASCSCFARLSC
jgi:hypothetical protein